MSIKDLFGKRSNQIVTQSDLDKLEKESKIIEEQIKQAETDTKDLSDNIYR